MVEGETSRIGEKFTETISGDTSGGRRDLSNRYLAPVVGGQKIDVEKFDGKINFGMWRREIISYLTKEVKYLVKDEECAMTLWRTLEEKYLLKSHENRLHAMSQVYGFRMKPGVSMNDHVSKFEKLLADLKNLDEDINDEVKVMILLHSLPEEYSHFVTTLIYGKSVIVFKDVYTSLTNLEIRNNDKHFEIASSKALGYGDSARVRRHNLYYLKGGTTDESNIVEAHSKKTRVKFGTANHDTREIFEYVHSDVYGPTKTVSIGGSHYFVTLLMIVLDNEGIKRHFTVRHTLQQNGVVERMNRTLLEKVQCMLSNAGLDKKFWAEAMSYASHLINLLPSAAIEVIDDDIPNTFGETLRSGESDQWKLAMEEEMKSLHQNQTGELVKLPKGKRAIGNKWVYTKKQGSLNQTTPRYKARLVVKGFAQKECIDYNEVFSPVVKHTSIRIILALVAEYELELAQLDVTWRFGGGNLYDSVL
ncbi:Integrase catalytic domain-containing protein [Citrus sinensis]|uniref:Integrase catalytic domain-containing protein n=1 Tax=Citrus sinensis TaxID=2711 RepID=A0ACB8NB25_CITSI|nr:Integrase catalytic domain-containing protein [Citrus sinensis]